MLTLLQNENNIKSGNQVKYKILYEHKSGILYTGGCIYYNIGTVGIIGGLKWNLGYACCRINKNCHFEDLKVKCKKLCNYQQDIYA